MNSFKEFAFWSDEEINLIEFNIDKTLDFLYDAFKHCEFDRSREAIRRKRNKILAKRKSKALKLLEEITIPISSTYKEDTILLIPDVHVTNDQDLSRCDYICNVIEERLPNVILFGGDFADFLSLSAWEKSNKLSVEGRRYKKEIEAVNEGLDKILAFRTRIKEYNPRIIYLLGNHENRLERYVESNPTMEGHMDLDTDLRLTSRGFEIVPYKKFIEVNSTLFTHAPLNAAAMPISGKYAAQKASELTSKSMVFFHTHQTQRYNCLRHGDEELIQIYNAGCFFEGPPPGGYSDDSTHATSRHLTILSFYKPGRFDVEELSLERLSNKYAKGTM